MGIRRSEPTLSDELPSNQSAVPLLEKNKKDAFVLYLENLSNETGIPYLAEIDIEDIDSELIRKLSLMLVREQQALPLWKENDELLVAISNPYDTSILNDYKIFYECPTNPVLFHPLRLPELINKAFDRAAQSASAVIEQMTQEGEIEEGEIEELVV